MKMIKSIYDSDVRYDAINDNITREGNDNDDTVARQLWTIAKQKRKGAVDDTKSDNQDNAIKSEETISFGATHMRRTAACCMKKKLIIIAART